MTLAQALRLIQEKLSAVSGDCALPEAERILTLLLDCSRSGLYLAPQKKLSRETAEQIEQIIRRRVRNDEPLAYILGSAYFYNREFIVTPDVLIPRPDTELLVEEVLKNETAGTCTFLDLGTGSGCIAAVLKSERPVWKAAASDVCFAALKIARKNCHDAVTLLCNDRLSAIKNRPQFDFIVCNPPYITSSVLPALEKSVRAHEPLRALDGGPDGLDFHRYCAEAAPLLLKKGGRIYCEIGYDQGKAVPEILSCRGWNGIYVTKDLGHRPRVVRAVKPQENLEQNKLF